MKRIVVLTLVVGLILGLGYIGLSPQSSAAPPQEPAPEGAILWKVLENRTLNPGEQFDSAWQDATPYRIFKFYAYVTPYEGVDPTGGFGTRTLTVMVRESPLGGESMPTRRITPSDGDWFATPPPPWWTPNGWRAVTEFEGLHSKISVRASNEGASGSPPITVSVYLLAAKE